MYLGEILNIEIDGQFLYVSFAWDNNCWGLAYLSYKSPSEYEDVFDEEERTIGWIEPEIGWGDYITMVADIPMSGTLDFQLHVDGVNWGEVYNYYFTLEIITLESLPSPDNFKVTKRLHKSFECEWDEVEIDNCDIEYVVNLSGDNEDVEQSIDVTGMILNEILTPGKTYDTYLHTRAKLSCEVAYNSEATYDVFQYYGTIVSDGDYDYKGPITISPSRPYISELSVVENRIKFAWELEDPETNISQVVFELYSSDGALLEKIADYSEEWHGDGSFEVAEDGKYYIVVKSNLYVNETVLWSLDDDGNTYKFKSAIITVSSKKTFSWSDYNVNGYENFLESGSRVRYLTKDAWNGLLDFMERNCYVEDFAIPDDSDAYGDCAKENYDVAINMCRMGENEGLLTSQIFNTVNYLVENMFGSAGIGLQYSKSPTYPVYAMYFWDIQKVINEKILEE